MPKLHLKKCPFGHLYLFDNDMNSECPLCNGVTPPPSYSFSDFLPQNPPFGDDGPIILMPDGFEDEVWIVKLQNKNDKREHWQCRIVFSITIGRDQQNDIAFPKGYDISISRLQCRIRRHLNNRFSIANDDYQGKANNPMLLNGEAIEKGASHPLRSGDELTMGRHVFTVEFQQIIQS